jgi:hypothetical protein
MECWSLANLDGCPHCQGPVYDKRLLTQYIEEIPVVRPHVTGLTTEEGWCERCQCEVGSTHPLQVSRAAGAAAVQLGPRALALACDLNKGKGLSMRKTVGVLCDHFGLKLTPGVRFPVAIKPQRVPKPGKYSPPGEGEPTSIQVVMISRGEPKENRCESEGTRAHFPGGLAATLGNFASLRDVRHARGVPD